MIYTDKTITVNQGNSKIDGSIVLYRGDREVEITFTILQQAFKFGKTDNLIKTANASYGQLIIDRPDDDYIFSDISACEEGKVKFIITQNMIDELTEVGFYNIQVRLYDDDMSSRITIPPVENVIEVREPIASEDTEALRTDGKVDEGIVNYAEAVASDPIADTDYFDDKGSYIKTTWSGGDLITQGKLNKIEGALSVINNKAANSSSNVDLSDYAKKNDIPTKVSELTNDKNYASESYVSNAIANSQLANLNLTVVKITVDDSGNTEEEPTNVPVTGLQLDLYTYDAKVGGFFYINPIVQPMNATNRAVTWKSSNDTIATVTSQGFVECIAEGDAVITCTTVEGGFTATCMINIEAAGGGETPQPVVYTITNNLTNVTSSNSASNVTENATYSATLTANSGYVLETVTITMGGTNITSTAYSNGNISISKVTGNIIITANAVVEQTEPDIPQTGGKIQFSTLERTAGGFKVDGTAHTLGGTYHVTIPYSEGMTIRTVWNANWNKDTYPAILVKTNGTYSIPTYTFTDGIISIGGKLPNGIDVTLTGYAEGSTVIVQMLIGHADTDDMNETDYLYYIPGGTN